VHLVGGAVTELAGWAGRFCHLRHLDSLREESVGDGIHASPVEPAPGDLGRAAGLVPYGSFDDLDGYAGRSRFVAWIDMHRW